MLQETIVAPMAVHTMALPTDATQAPVQPSLFIRGISATLRQNSLGNEIKFTATESETVNQLPQSGIRRNTRCCSTLIQGMIVGTIIHTDRNTSLKHMTNTDPMICTGLTRQAGLVIASVLDRLIQIVCNM